jgi:hypothetical protein
MWAGQDYTGIRVKHTYTWYRLRSSSTVGPHTLSNARGQFVKLWSNVVSGGQNGQDVVNGGQK